MPDSRWPAARRVLAVRLESLGHVMMTTVASRALRDSAHDRYLTLLTSIVGSKLERAVPGSVSLAGALERSGRTRETPQ